MSANACPRCEHRAYVWNYGELKCFACGYEPWQLVRRADRERAGVALSSDARSNSRASAAVSTIAAGPSRNYRVRITPEQAHAAWLRHGSQLKAATALNVSMSTFCSRLRDYRQAASGSVG